ncbi:MAG TPA: type III-A CRISPR-associated RAMP protein Csm4 [Anaerolineales bacterium]|nr:type III-A CRISPR-associated RAMP protein Csm4 [Anaerolineales bacterium]
MPTLDIYRLTFRDGLHVGFHGIGQEKVLAHIPSDTLFAALVSTRSHWHGDADQWVANFGSEPPLRLTSAFPYAGDVLFYPRPLKAPMVMDPKGWRKIRFVSETILGYLLKGEVPEAYLLASQNEEPAKGLGLQNGSLWLAMDEKEKLPSSLLTKKIKGKVERLNLKAIQRQQVWQEKTIPRVTVDRVSNTSEIFHTGRIQFKEGCGLWFGVQWKDQSLRAEMEETLRVLGDTGLGAERSVGYGAFTYNRAENSLPYYDPPPGGRLFLLSRFYPADAEDAKSLLDGATYDLVRVTGRVQTVGAANQRRQGVHLIVEGSLIGGTARGGLAEVSPKVGSFPHNVYRYGLALGIGVEAQ